MSRILVNNFFTLTNSRKVPMSVSGTCISSSFKLFPSLGGAQGALNMALKTGDLSE